MQEGGDRAVHAGTRRCGSKRAQVTPRGSGADGVVPILDKEAERAGLREYHVPEEGSGGRGEPASVLSRLRSGRESLVPGPTQGSYSRTFSYRIQQGWQGHDGV